MLLYYSLLASQDLDAVLGYLYDVNPQAAIKLAQDIDTACDQLRIFPFSGYPRPDINDGWRHKLVSNYLLLYIVFENEIQIVRIIHGARNLSDLL